MPEIKINQSVLEKTIGRAREKNIILPTFSQQKNPDTIPQKIKVIQTDSRHLNDYKT